MKQRFEKDVGNMKREVWNSIGVYDISTTFTPFNTRLRHIHILRQSHTHVIKTTLMPTKIIHHLCLQSVLYCHLI